MPRIVATLCLLTVLCASPAAGDSRRGEAETPYDRPILLVAHDAYYPPFCFFDSEGEPAGYLVDLWRAFGSENDMEIVFKLGTWQESLDMVLDGRADVHGGLVHSADRDRIFDFGPDIIELSTHIHVRKGRDAAKARPVGVVRGGYEEYFMRANRPGTPLILFDENLSMIGAAARGEYPAFAADTPTASACLAMHDSRDDFDRADLLYRKPLRAAVVEGRHDILNLVIHGWERMDQKRIVRIHGKWFMDAPERSPWIVRGMLIGLLVLVLALAVRLLSQRHRRVE